MLSPYPIHLWGERDLIEMYKYAVVCGDNPVRDRCLAEMRSRLLAFREKYGEEPSIGHRWEFVEMSRITRNIS